MITNSSDLVKAHPNPNITPPQAEEGRYVLPMFINNEIENRFVYGIYGYEYHLGEPSNNVEIPEPQSRYKVQTRRAIDLNLKSQPHGILGSFLATKDTSNEKEGGFFQNAISSGTWKTTLERWNRENLAIVPAFIRGIENLDDFKDNAKDSWNQFTEGLGGMGSSIADLAKRSLDLVLADMWGPARSFRKTPKEKAIPRPMEEFLNLFREKKVTSQDLIDFELYKKSEVVPEHFWIPWGSDTVFERLNPIRGSFRRTEQNIHKPHPQRNRRGFSPPEMIQNIGADFLQHKFDAFFIWNFMEEDQIEMDQAIENAKWLTPYEKHILSRSGFAVRVGQITVPHIINEEFTLQFLQTEIKKIKSTKEINNQSTFSIRMDQNLIWLNQINEFAGRKNSVDETILLKADVHPYIKAAEKNKNLEWRYALKTIAKSWPFHESGIPKRIKKSELCLIIKMVHLSNWIQPSYQQDNLPWFVFENVRILGTSDKITYNREGNDILNMNVNFIFRRCYQINQGFMRSAPNRNLPIRDNTNSVLEISRNTDFIANTRRIVGIPQIPAYGKMFDWRNRDPNTFRIMSESPAIKGNI